ncbi:MAG TPA: plastocyanin/azurin family copper-binding protein [Pseudonocardiaceae bacterium]|nr:plastocyanin/azurin family copper-binding protein [Pseudonocardiaceae bacterium]
MRTTGTTATPVTGRNWARSAVAGAVLGGVAVLTAACGGSGGSTPSGGSSGAAQTTASASGSGSSSGTQVTATLTEYHIALSTSTFAPGTYTFVAKNAGQVGHALEIDGPGVSGQKTSGIQPGQSVDLTVTLSAGAYDVYCPVPGHKGLGMDTKITVSGSGAGAGGGSQAPATTQQATSNSGGGGYGGY